MRNLSVLSLILFNSLLRIYEIAWGFGETFLGLFSLGKLIWARLGTNTEGWDHTAASIKSLIIRSVSSICGSIYSCMLYSWLFIWLIEQKYLCASYQSCSMVDHFPLCALIFHAFICVYWKRSSSFSSTTTYFNYKKFFHERIRNSQVPLPCRQILHHSQNKITGNPPTD